MAAAEFDYVVVGAGSAAAVLSYLFHRIEGRLDGSPTLIIIDEGWLVLDQLAVDLDADKGHPKTIWTEPGIFDTVDAYQVFDRERFLFSHRYARDSASQCVSSMSAMARSIAATPHTPRMVRS